MWHANFTYQPEYFAYARPLGPGLDKCVSRVVLPPRLIEGRPELPFKYIGRGSYPKATIQDATYQDMAGLRARCFEFQTFDAFAYFPWRIMGLINAVYYPNLAHSRTNKMRREIELVRSLDWACRCARQELLVNHQALGMVQSEIRSIEALHPEFDENEEEFGIALVHIQQ